MRNGLIVLLPGTETAPLFWGHWRDGRIVESGQSSLEDINVLAGKNLPVALILSGQNAQTFTHEIPKMRRREREKAVLFSLEDNLSVPFETLHVAMQDDVIIEETPLSLATVLSKNLMDEARDWARQNGLNVQYILTDYDALTGTEAVPLALPDRVVYAGPLGHTLDMDWYDGPLKAVETDKVLSDIGTRLPDANNLMQGPYAPK